MSQLAIDISKRLDLYVRKNQAIDQNIAVNNVDGTPFDFSGYGATMQVFTGPADTSPNISLTVTLSEGNIRFQLAANKLPRQSEFIYFLKLNNVLWLNGKFTINGGLFDGIVNTESLTINLLGTPVYLTINSGTGSGGGPQQGLIIDTVSGGLTFLSGILKLGGDLFENVLISGASAFGMDFADITYFKVNVGAGKHFYIDEAGNIEIETTDSHVDVKLSNKALRVLGGGLIISDTDVELPASVAFFINSLTKLFQFNSIPDLSAVTTPADGMVAFSEELDDIVARIGSQWIGVTRPKIIITSDTTVLLTEAERNSILILTTNGDKIVQLPKTGLSEGYTCFVQQRSSTTGTIQLVPIGTSPTPLDAFDDKIYKGGASVFQSTVGTWHASGSLGPIVDSDDVYTAIDQAEADAKAYADTLVGAGEPDATDTVKGIAKLYPDVAGSNSDGAPSQAAVRSEFDDVYTAFDDKEDIANKSTNVNLGSSDTLYPSQNAVKTYVDNAGGTPQSLVIAYAIALG